MFHPVGNECLPRWPVDDLTIWFLAGSLASVDYRGSCILARVAASSNGWGEESRRAHPWPFLMTSSWYTHVLTSMVRRSRFYYFETRVLNETLCWWQEPHFVGASCPSATGGGIGYCSRC
jgi:hypothetical protein